MNKQDTLAFAICLTVLIILAFYGDLSEVDLGYTNHLPWTETHAY